MVKLPMIFNSPNAFARLIKGGSVYSFRVGDKKPNGLVWIKQSRLGKKITDAKRICLGEFNPNDLLPYVWNSGFKSLGEWLGEIKRLNGYIPLKGYLYLVRIE